MSAKRPSWLPALLADIAGATSIETALALAEAKGGQRVHLPSAPAAGHWLTLLVGAEHAAIIGRDFGPGDIDVPRGPTGSFASFRRSFYQQLDRLEREGLSANAIAEAAGTTLRTVKRNRAARRAHNAPRLL